METLIIIAFLVVATLINTFVVIYFFGLVKTIISPLTNQVIALITAQNTTNTYLKNIFVVSEPSPNEATEIKDEGVEFSEDHPMKLPENIRVEVEGGDMDAPPDFDVPSN